MMRSVLIANRGEIAIRIAHACAALGIRTVSVHSRDDVNSLHVSAADESIELPGSGPAAYLDGDALVTAARQMGCDGVHPGYGFLSENAGFARACASEGLTFVGPSAELLEMFGDKAQARAFAAERGVPLLKGVPAPTDRAAVAGLLASLGPGGAVMVKAVAGGGGRGIRVVLARDEIDNAIEQCRAEAATAFANDALFAEQFVEQARHIEVQVVGDGCSVMHLGERDCSIQRRHQKIVEIAPAQGLADGVRAAVIAAALRMVENIGYRGLATVEFLLDVTGDRFAFLEVNPRLQVEHTITEAVTGIDLVQAQLRIASGATLEEVGLGLPVPVTGCAIQFRVNLEEVGNDGTFTPSAGTILAYDPPGGPGIRIDGYGYTGYRTSTRYDPLLAKLIVTGENYHGVLARAERALAGFRIEGVGTNIAFLRRLTLDPTVSAGTILTSFIAQHGPSIAGSPLPPLRRPAISASAVARPTSQPIEGPPGSFAVTAGMPGTVIAIMVDAGALVHAGEPLAIVEAMKMEHVIVSPEQGRVLLGEIAIGDTVASLTALAFILPEAVDTVNTRVEAAIDLDAIRPDLAANIARHDVTLDAARPDAVARRRARGQRTARENVTDLLDPGSLREYGALVIAAQRRRRTLADLVANTPADGLVAGIGTINADRYGADRGRCVVLAYDATVLAGTQGWMNHKKTDRMLALAYDLKSPLILFGEGGGGRPGDTDIDSHGLEIPTFHHMARLSGRVPLVAVVSGRCFAGNAALVGCCDVVIATADANIGMGGPAMVEGGGLGQFPPEAIGPTPVQSRNGVIDLVAANEAEATALARQYLAFFQGANEDWSCTDQRHLRWLVPENRVRSYDVRAVIEALADTGSVLELRRAFGNGIITALARIEGRPIGIVANNSLHLGGAIDGDGAGKAARFLQLCDAFALPVVNLIDTPGFMVGPEIEETAQVRRVAQMLVVAASCTIPMFNVVMRKAYGLGALGIGGGSFHAPTFTIAWPTGEFGGMNLEGAVRLGYKKELAAIQDETERRRWYQEKLAAAYADSKADAAASHFQLDAVVDPADTRNWISRGLAELPTPSPASGERRSFVSAW